LEESFSSPWTWDDFQELSKEAAQKKLGKNQQDYQGCYVFRGDQVGETYIGISRNVIGRIWTHFKGPTHQQTSFVYKVARHEPDSQIQHHRQDTDHRTYRREFNSAQQKIRGWKVAHVPVDDVVTLYLLEVAAAMRFDAHPLNSFLPH